MQVVMMESEAYQNLIDRLERIEKYVVRTTERQAALDDLEAKTPTKNEKYIKTIEFSAKQLRSMIDQLLDYFRLESNRRCAETKGLQYDRVVEQSDMGIRLYSR